MLGVTFGSKHSYNDWGIWLEDTHINPPLPKRYIVNVPARNGLLDLTPELTPTIRFENRTLTFNFRVKAGDWSTLVSQIYCDIHGRTLDVVSDLDPDWHWHGCVTVDDFSSDERTGVLVITVDADPFKLSNTENSYTVNGNGTITCVVDRMEISPAFELTAPTTVIYGDSSYVLESTATTEKTLSGDIVSFADGTANPAVDLTVDIEATQDLHGYDHPWAGGAGKNLLPIVDTPTYSGLTIIKNNDGSYNISGKPNSNGSIEFYNDVLNPIRITEPCIFTSEWNPQGNATIIFSTAESSVAIQISNSDTLNIPIGEYTRFRIYVNSANTYNFTFKPMLRLASVSDATFEPYSNICPISGWDEVDVNVVGNNFCGAFTIGKGINTVNGAEIDNPTGAVTDYLPIKFESSDSYYRITGLASELNNIIAAYNVKKEFLGRTGGNVSANRNLKQDSFPNGTPQGTGDVAYVRVYIYKSSSQTADINIVNGLNVMLNMGNEAVPYEPYNGQTYTIDLNGTRYGGTLDVTTGVLTIDKGYADLSEKTWTRRQAYTFSTSLEDSCNNAVPISEHFSDMFNVIYVAGYSGLNSDAIGIYHPSSPTGSTGTIYFRYSGIGEDSVSGLTAWFANNKPHLVYELATPQVVQLTAEQVMILKNQNNIWADSGEVEVTYLAQDFAGKKFYIPDLELTEGSHELTIQGTGTTTVTYTNGRL